MTEFLLRRTVLSLALCAASCGNPSAVRVTLQADNNPDVDARRVVLRAQISGPIHGLRYKWFAVNGHGDPQESDAPETTFIFADGVKKDRVRVELWRGDERVAMNELDVALDDGALPRELARRADVSITKVPPYDVGGPETRADIGGRVTGDVSEGLRVVIYARAGDVWYVQPMPYARHAIAGDGSWGTWTHTGTSYAALVVQPLFAPLPRYDVLPQVGGPVVARAIVEGERR